MSPTPEQLAEMWAWYQERKVQQIANPLDVVSRNLLFPNASISDLGAGATTLTQIIGTAGATATVPAAFLGSEKLVMPNGVIREFPYIA